MPWEFTEHHVRPNVFYWSPTAYNERNEVKTRREQAQEAYREAKVTVTDGRGCSLQHTSRARPAYLQKCQTRETRVQINILNLNPFPGEAMNPIRTAQPMSASRRNSLSGARSEHSPVPLNPPPLTSRPENQGPAPILPAPTIQGNSQFRAAVARSDTPLRSDKPRRVPLPLYLFTDTIRTLLRASFKRQSVP
jgi:hypothetical protein